MELPHRNILNAFLILTILLAGCSKPDPYKTYREATTYLNLNDTVEYVGMMACRDCHYKNYLGFLRTGMGLSFDTASPRKSAAVMTHDSILYDPYKNLYYLPFWSDETLMIEEYRLENGNKIHSRTERVDFVIGSGQHTNSHIFLSGNYAFQVPFTYYTQDGRFDFPPGFEAGQNSRFSRKIGLECMSCHNGLPGFVLGSENKYFQIPDGIDCERCHGPGEIHVMLMRKSQIVDTSKYIDFSIVNPRKLNPELQTDLCARCHLQGTMVLKPGRSFYDFKPGMSLTEVMDIFMPRFEGGQEDFIMASHYERMVQSTCFLASGGNLTCITCHNPHVPRSETPVGKYNRVCAQCHTLTEKSCAETAEKRQLKNNNCIVCHMRESGTRDIPHVRIHDHRITVPPAVEETKTPRVFKGLVAVNNPRADSLTIARGYLLEYEAYHPDPGYLDSAARYLASRESSRSKLGFHARINLLFLRNDYQGIRELVERQGIRFTLDSLLKVMDYNNYDAWTAYRIGQAYQNLGNLTVAEYFLEKATNLAQYNLEFQNNYGSLLVLKGNPEAARKVFEFIVAEDSKYAPAWVNLGYSWVLTGNGHEAVRAFETALRLDPDNIMGHLNLAGIYAGQGRLKEAEKLAYRAMELDPANKDGLRFLKMLKQKH